MKPIIIGAGLAGLTVALALAPLPVILVSPRKLGEGCSSAWAQGGIAAAIGAEDSAAWHAKDTMAVGNGLNDAAIVEQTTQDAARVIERLVARGVAFDRDALGQLRLGLEAAHSQHRIVHAKDATGRAVMQALVAAVSATPSIQVIEKAIICDLVVDDAGIAGVIVARDGEKITLSTRQAVLATGGAAGLWRDTTNPHENWGGGLAVAARAGAALGDLEFTQFHPTAIDIGRDPMPLASEALRGEGAILIDETGSRFTAELQARDIVTRAIWQHMSAGHRVYLDARQGGGGVFAEHFPTIYASCMSAGIDPTLSPIPVRPAAHYHMGGVKTDAQGRTDVTGLWACGEVACTGLHGANRLASNSLLEAASFGARVAEDMKNSPSASGLKYGAGVSNIKSHRVTGYAMTQEKAGEIRALMSDHVGVIRDRAGLEKAISLLSPLAGQSDRALVGLMVAQAALRREESRGAHYRHDFPQTLAVAARSHYRLADRKNADAA